MPLKWERGKKSPYACNYFAVLHVGPNTRTSEIQQTGDETLRVLKTGSKALCACGHEVDVHQAGQATTLLQKGRPLAEELLLIHPQPDSDNRAKVKTLADNLHKAASLPIPRGPIPLRHPTAVFWFVPLPGDDTVELPEWLEVGLVNGGDPDDLALDIIFDR